MNELFEGNGEKHVGLAGGGDSQLKGRREKVAKEGLCPISSTVCKC